MVIKKNIRKIKKSIRTVFMFFNELRFNTNIKNVLSKKNIKKIEPFYDKSIKIQNISSINIGDNFKGKYVGAVNYNNIMYCIPNKKHAFLKLDLSSNKHKLINFDYEDDDEFLWTGGCIYKDRIFGFPRYSNDLICLNPKDEQVKIINLKLNYKKEHHYGGVCTKEGIIYQPPRKNNTILSINLNDYSVHEIKISPDFLQYDFATGLIAENGLIYFFPSSKGKILVLNPDNEKFSFIGERIKSSTFGPCIGVDNNIYGFSSYSEGILKIDICNNHVEMLHKEIGCPGCYGNKLGINGKIYGIPGNGSYVWEYDTIEDKVSKVEKIGDTYAKCAGGIVAENGSIYTVPAFGDKIHIMNFDKQVKLNEEQLNSLYNRDYY